MACLALPYFSTLSQKGTIFEKKIIEHARGVLIFSTSAVWNIFYFFRRIH